MFNEVRQDDSGTLYCGLCFIPLKLQDKVIGIQDRRTYDVFWCPSCAKMYWLPPRSGGPGNRPKPHAETIDA
jgi:hypothetical protein